ncbi:MAG: hypothetical protein V3W18_01755 [candidate division Zixibacteria bacterium]
MRKSLILAIVLITAVFYGSGAAQTTKLIFGPLEGDSAGIIHTYEGATVDVDVWIRTEQGIRIVGMHLPLSSNNEYISSRNDGTFEEPLWDWWVADFLDPNDDPENDGYTNQSIMGVSDDLDDAIETNGEWWKIATYKMAAGATDQFNIPFCNAFIEGTHPDNGGIVLVDFNQGELDPSQYELDFACLQFEQFCGDYILCDYNGNGSVNVADLLNAYSYLVTCAPYPAVLCQCPPGEGETFAVAFDLNNSCTFNIADFYLFMKYYPDNFWRAEPCEYCQPPEQ